MFIHTFKRKNFNDPQREGPFKVVLTTPTSVTVEDRDHWYHLNHCSHAARKGLLHPTEEGKARLLCPTEVEDDIPPDLPWLSPENGGDRL